MFYAQMAPTANAGLIVATPTRRRGMPRSTFQRRMVPLARKKPPMRSRYGASGPRPGKAEALTRTPRIDGSKSLSERLACPKDRLA